MVETANLRGPKMKKKLYSINQRQKYYNFCFDNFILRPLFFSAPMIPTIFRKSVASAQFLHCSEITAMSAPAAHVVNSVHVFQDRRAKGGEMYRAL